MSGLSLVVDSSKWADKDHHRHHRLTLLTHLSPPSPQAEIDFIHNALLPDPKNYHTWAYLHWIYSHFSTLGRISEQDWQAELEWCEELLRVDGRNNSAWGWRWFLRISRPGASVDGKAKGEEEIVYVASLPYASMNRSKRHGLV